MLDRDSHQEVPSQQGGLIKGLIDSLWNEYRNRNYMSPPEGGFRIDRIVEIPEKEWDDKLNISEVSDHTHDLWFFDVNLAIRNDFFEKYEDFPLLLTGSDKFTDFLQSRYNNGQTRLQLVAKQMSMEMGNSTRESSGYERLNELGISTPICIYPNILTDQPVTLDSKLAEPYVITVLH